MREDMFKVIVERPRRLNSNAYSRDGRRYRNQEESPMTLGMKCGYSDRKWLNENLVPLRRYLESQVNRPWDKVYSDICVHIDTRSTVKQHILQHLDDFVALHARIINDEIMIRGRWPQTYRPLHESDFALFVDPRTGILRKNRHYISWTMRKRGKQAKDAAARLETRRVIADRVQLHRIDGIWFQVELDILPAAQEVVRQVKGQWIRERTFAGCRDVLRKEWVTREHGQIATPSGQPSNQAMYDAPDLYARSKRQLSSRELQKFGLPL